MRLLICLFAASMMNAQIRFLPAADCAICHSRIPDREAVSVAPHALWSQSMMAHSAKDSYWAARVRMEIAEGAATRDEVEDLCTRCHAPADQYPLRTSGKRLALGKLSPLGRDGVTCTVCHQITERRLGEAGSFTAGFSIEPLNRIFGPHATPFAMPMLHHTGFEPAESTHVRESSLCGSCHTVVIQQRNGVAPLVEQGPFLEWAASRYPVAGRTCQSCHMPLLDGAEYIAHRPPGGPFPPTRPRRPFARHEFAGGNVGGAEALGNLQSAARAGRMLAGSLRLTLNAVRAGRRLTAAVTVDNLTGHKLPTGFPSRRVWLHLTISDAQGRALFESGSGDPGAQPHHALITRPEQAQVFESESADVAGKPTVSLLRAVRHFKDNRILPAGFTQSRFPILDIEPHGVAIGADFSPGRAVTRYAIDVPAAACRITVEALYQSVKPLHLPPGEPALALLSKPIAMARAERLIQ